MGIDRARRRSFAALAVLSAAVSAACLVSSCRKPKAGAPAPARPVNAALALDYPGVGDAGKNDSAWKGFLGAAKETGAALSDGKVSYGFGDHGRMLCLQPRAAGRDRDQLVRVMAENGYALVILMGEAYAEAAKAVSPDFPDTLFVILDAPAREGFGSNCRFVEFDAPQGSYLAGALAASLALTNEKSKLGFVCQDGSPEAGAVFEAWKSGATRENPDLAQSGRLPARFLKADSVEGKKLKKGLGPEEALSQLDKTGVTAAFWAAGAPGPNILERAKSSGIYLFCYPEDAVAKLPGSGASQAVLASVVKRFDKAVGIVLKAFGDPVSAPRAALRLGLKEGCVELAFNESMRSLTDSRKVVVEKAAAALIEGSVRLNEGEAGE